MRSTIALGEKRMEGNYRRILAAGDIWLTNSKTGSIYAAGDIDIKSSVVKKLRLAGDFDGDSVVIGSGKVVGDIDLKGICKADRMVVFGDVNCEYLECICLRHGSPKGKNTRNSRISGFYKATTFESTMPVIVSFDYEFENMIISSSLRASTELVCTKFYGLGKISSPAINADTVFLLANNGTKIGEITGSKVTVSTKFKLDKAFRSIPKTLRIDGAISDESIIDIDAISADKVTIEYVKATSVSGIDVKIGDLSIVEEVTYQNSLTISDKAIVGRVVKQ